MPHTTRSASASDDEGTYIYAPYNPEDDSDYVPGDGDSAPEDYEIQLDEEDEEDEDDAPEELMNINPRALLQSNACVKCQSRCRPLISFRSPAEPV